MTIMQHFCTTNSFITSIINIIQLSVQSQLRLQSKRPHTCWGLKCFDRTYALTCYKLTVLLVVCVLVLVSSVGVACPVHFLFLIRNISSKNANVYKDSQEWKWDIFKQYVEMNVVLSVGLGKYELHINHHIYMSFILHTSTVEWN